MSNNVTAGIKGYVKIDKYNAEFVDGEWVPRELVETIEEKNRLTPYLAYSLMNGTTAGYNDPVVCVSEFNHVGAIMAAPDDTSYWVKGTVAVGETYTPPVLGGADAFWEMASTISPPGSTRFIRALCLTSANTSYDQRPYTIVTLPTPCEQEPAQILQITYRVINDQSAVAAAGISTSVSTRQFANLFNTNVLDYTPLSVYPLNYDSTVWGKGLGRGYRSITRSLGVNSTNQEIYTGNVANAFSTDYVPEGLVAVSTVLRLGINNVSTSSEDPCGMPIKAMAMGTNLYHSSISDVGKGSLSSVGNVFGRIADTGVATKPYLDNNIIASSAADVNLIDKGDWVEHMPDSYLVPYQYRIKIETGGNVGVSAYTLQRRRSPVRWVDNRTTWNAHGSPFMHCGLYANNTEEEYMDPTTADTRKHGQTIVHSRAWADSSNDIYIGRNDLGDTRTMLNRYVYPEAYTWDYDGITFFSLKEHNWINLDTNSAQSTPFTEILQIGSDGLDVYIADASQGLYKVERDFDDYDTTNWTITKLSPPGITDTDSCRGVYLKGGSYHGHPGKVVDINIVRGGSNYAVDDTVTITGVNGTSAAANVARVDADGAITAVAITNQGSGYIEDHIQAYVSTGSGVGAQLDPIIGAGGDLWAIFNDATDGAVYMARMSHIVDDSTSLNFDSSNPYVITGNGTSFLTQGFRVGQRLIVRHAEEIANEGTYTISAVTATTITVTEAITTTNAADTQAQIIGEAWEVMKETIADDNTSLTFANASSTITASGGTAYDTQGFVEGMLIEISGSASNNGTLTITDVTGSVITVAETLTDETVGATLESYIDFTITNYTADDTEGAGIIGIIMDPDHADNRFAILTPSTKQANDGGSLQSTAGFDWWSYANSLSTTAGGTGTDRVRVAGSNNDNRSGSLEQYATHTLGPITDSDIWLISGLGVSELSQYTWGSGTRTDRNDNAMVHRYLPIRCKTNFDIGVLASGSSSVCSLKFNRTTVDFADTTFDSILARYSESQSETSLSDYNPGQWSGNEGPTMHGYFGKGVWMSRMGYDGGGFMYTGNSDGTRAGEDAMPYGVWQDFGWDGTRWVLDDAGTRTTHAQSSFSGSSLNINATSGAIIGTGFASTDWAGDGFEAGDIITLTDPDNPENDGDYRIETLSGTTLTVTPDKLPTTTDAATAGTVIGHRAIIDGMALSFDDNSGAAPLAVDEYYDCYVYDGIINDNATSGTITTYAPWLPTETGTDFESSTIPVADVGAVVNEPLTMQRKTSGYGESDGTFFWCDEPGVWASASIQSVQDEIAFSDQQIPASTDFTLRFKLANCINTGNGRWDVGVAPQALANNGTQYTDTSLDYNCRVSYDPIYYPTQNTYYAEYRNSGSGTVQYTEVTDRATLIAGQTHTNYTGGAPNGSFIGGYGSATDTHAASDVITMNDGSIVTVDAVDGNGTITEFTVTSGSTKTSARSAVVSQGANDWSNVNIQAAPTNTITRSNGTGFVTDGFTAGMVIGVFNTENNSNRGVYTIDTVTETVITTVEDISTTNTDDDSIDIQQMARQIGAVSSSATSIDFNTTGNVITRTAGGTDFVADGFRIGMKIQVDGATTEANDAAYTIQSLTTTTIVTEENLNTTESGTSATIQHAIVQEATTGSGVNFALIPGVDNLEDAVTGGDEFALNRRGTTGNNLYWTINGIEVYTHTGGPFNANYNPCGTTNNTHKGTIYDFNIDHTIDRRYLKIGNGTTTGAFDTNFRCLPAQFAGTDQLRLYYDNGAGPVEFTYNQNGYVAPSAGEVTILPFSGVLWFNSAQGGDTLTGNWTSTLKINLS